MINRAQKVGWQESQVGSRKLHRDTHRELLLPRARRLLRGLLEGSSWGELHKAESGWRMRGWEVCAIVPTARGVRNELSSGLPSTDWEHSSCFLLTAPCSLSASPGQCDHLHCRFGTARVLLWTLQSPVPRQGCAQSLVALYARERSLCRGLCSLKISCQRHGGRLIFHHSPL